MSHKIYIHIGTHKTGSTSIQSFLRKNISVLNNNNIHVPTIGTNSPISGHHNIAWGLRKDYRYKHELGGVNELIKDLEICMKKKAVISSEDFEYCVNYPDALIELDNKLKEIGWVATYIAFLRRQDHYAESLYSTLINFGLSLNYKEFVDHIISQRSFSMNFDWYFNFDYYDFYKRWTSIVGNRLVLKSFDGAIAKEGIIKSFIRTIGIYEENLSLIKNERLNARSNSTNKLKDAALVTKLRDTFNQSNIDLKNLMNVTNEDFSTLLAEVDQPKIKFKIGDLTKKLFNDFK